VILHKHTKISKKNRITKKVGRGEACHKKEKVIYFRGGEERVILEVTVP